MKFRPMCLSGRIQAAVNNRGQLMPCCYCDEPWALNSAPLKQLMEVSKVSEVDDIEEILFSEPWIKFEEDLRTENWDGIPKICIFHCQDRGEDNLKTETYHYKGEKIGESKV